MAVGPGTGVGFRRRRIGGGLPGPISDPAVSAIRANGWSVDYADPPPAFDPVLDPRHLMVVSPGYTETGAATTVARSVVLTSRVRQPYPAHGSPTASEVALSDYVFAGDTVMGAAANNSTAPYPKVIADWALPPKRRCGPGGSLDLEVVALHAFARNGRPVACVRITGTPASGAPVTRIAAWVRAADGTPCYRATFTHADFAAGQTVEFGFEAFPWIGDAGAVRDSSGGAFPSVTAATAPQQHWWGERPRAADVFVSASGNDGTGAVASSLAAAKAAPFATIAAALQALIAGGAELSGARLFVGAGTHDWLSASTTGTRSAQSCWFEILGDPDDPDPKANCIVRTVGTTYPVVAAGGAGTMSWIRLADLGVRIAAGNHGFLAGSSGRTTFWLDNLAWISAMTAATVWAAQAYLYATGGSYTAANAAALALQGTSANLRLQLVRGVATNRPVGANLMISVTQDAAAITHFNFQMGEQSNLRAGNLILFNSRVAGWLGTGGPCVNINQTGGLSDIALVQLDFEPAATCTNPMIAFGENYASAPRPFSNIVLDYLTMRVGADSGALRVNVHNDPANGFAVTDPAAPQASYVNFCFRRSKLSWVAVKDDVFDLNGNLVQGWAKRYGVGWRDLNSAYSPDLFPPDFFGLNTARASSGARLIPAGAEHHGLDWDIDGTVRPVDGSCSAGAMAA